MEDVDRRRWLAGAAALTLLAPAGAASGQARFRGTGAYDYLFVDLKPGAGQAARAALRETAAMAQREAAAAGGTLLGAFAPQLGWKSSEAALLFGWPAAAPRRDATLARIAAAPTLRSSRRDRLSPTARPQAGERPRSGGIYTHRWFVVGAADLDEVVALSVEGWRDFEARFDTNIFGLFAAEASAADRRERVRRLLLVTRYRDHAAWEASRDPTSTAMNAFARRQRLTRDSWVASNLLIAPAP